MQAQVRSPLPSRQVEPVDAVVIELCPSYKEAILAVHAGLYCCKVDASSQAEVTGPCQ